MPNPTVAYSKQRLTARQKATVRKLRARKLPIRVYRRASSRSGWSVHNPFLDVRRRARKGTTKTVKRYPHARDTELQRKVRFVGKKPKGARKVRTPKRFLLP